MQLQFPLQIHIIIIEQIRYCVKKDHLKHVWNAALFVNHSDNL